MTKKEVLAILRTSTPNDEELPFHVVEEMTDLGILQVTLTLDGKSYMYRVNVDDIVDKEINPDSLYNPGWHLSSDETFIYKII